jgi:hypothetical protein
MAKCSRCGKTSGLKKMFSDGTWMCDSCLKKGKVKGTEKHRAEADQQDLRTKKSRNLRNFAIAIIVFFIVVTILSNIIPKTSTSSSDQTKTGTQYTYITESPSQMLDKWQSYTDLKKQEMWDSYYKGKRVHWTVYVKQISNDWYTEYQLLGNIERPTQYTIQSDVGVRFRDDQLKQLALFDKGSSITFEGTLSSYGSIINSNIFYVKDAVIVSPT